MFEQFYFLDVFVWMYKILNGVENSFIDYVSGQSLVSEEALKLGDGEVAYKLVRGGKGRIMVKREHFEVFKSAFVTVKNFVFSLLRGKKGLSGILGGEVVEEGGRRFRMLRSIVKGLELFSKDLLSLFNSARITKSWLGTALTYLSKSVYSDETLFVEKNGEKMPFYELKPLEFVVSRVKDKFNFFKSYIITSNDVLVNSFINSLNYSISVSDDTEEYHYRVARGDFWREYSAVFDMVWRVMGKSGNRRMSV